MKIGYFADGPWSHRALEKILLDSSLKVEFICARHDIPDYALKEIANKNKIFFLTHSNVNSNDFLMQIEKYNCELFVSMSFNQIFKPGLANYPVKKTINCHAGNLPFYRGRNVLNWVLINDEKEFGITVHYIDEGIDTGDIILQKKYLITDKDDYSTLLKRSYVGCAEILYKSIKMIQKKGVKIIHQSDIHQTGFYCSQRKEGDEIINWDNNSREIFNFIRALCHPGPKARTFLDGNDVFINKAEMISRAPVFIGINGAVLNSEKNKLIVKTNDSFISISEWECSRKIKIGDRLK